MNIEKAMQNVKCKWYREVREKKEEKGRRQSKAKRRRVGRADGDSL